MGNNQSTIGHHNRLSKPKTNTNSPGLAPAVESPASVKSRYTDLSAKGRYHIQETPLSPLETENGWPSKDEDAVGELAPRSRGRPLSVISRSNSRANSRTNSRTNSRSNSLSCFGSKHGSTTKLGDVHGSKTSLNGQVDLDAAIRLLQEVKKNGSPEDLAALHEALDGSADNALPIVNGPPLSRRTSSANGSCSSLTRRRSLVQTPGVATRNSPVDGRRRTWNSWKAPQIAPEEEAKWAVSSKGITPLNRQSVPGTLATTPSYSSPRARTPSEMDYSHLGSLQLGTLSIVNGAPSPAASTRMVAHRPQQAEEVDYFTAAEAGSSPLTMKTRRRGHTKSKSSVLPATAPLYNIETQKEVHPVRPTTQHSSARRDNPDSRSATQQPCEAAKTFRIANDSIQSDGQGAKKYAQDYQAYIPYSPFAQKFPKAVQEESGPTEGETSFREEANQLLAGTMFDAPTTASETSGSVLFSSTVPRVQVSEDQPQKSNTRPSPRTIDSGYSSGGSLTERGRRSADSSRDRGKDERTALHIPDRLERPSTSESLRSPMSPCSVTSKSSMESTRSSTQKRLQKRRPSQPELVIQSCQSIPEGNIPDVPDNVRAKFTRRLSHTPDMECLTKTFPSKDHDLATKAPSEVTDSAPAETFTQLTELEPERPPVQPTHGRHRSLSLFRRKSIVENKDSDKEDMDASVGVVDLGTIAASLGSSPYDAAMSGQRRKSVTSPTHPHQLGSTLPRAKSMVSMDAEAAAEFARMRSRDRALMEQEMPPMPKQRRRSFHNLKIDAGEAKASRRRPQHSLHDIPPVPTIDASKLKAPLSAKPRLEREPEQKVSGASFSARCQAKGEVVSQMVYKYDHSEAKAPTQTTLEWDEHARHWSHRRKSLGEGLRTRASFNEASASTINSRNNTQPRVDMAAWGRYSGGLEYNYEGRGAVGVGGSAGTRSLHSAASSKSMQWRNQHGVDFSDVPIMLQRA